MYVSYFLMFSLVSVLYADIAFRSTICCGGATVDRRIEVGIVIHLELAVEFENSITLMDSGPDRIETSGEIGALLLKQ